MASEGVHRTLLLDTHCWLWSQLGTVHLLSRAALGAIREAESHGNLRISPISIWELALLEKRGRVALPMNVPVWVEEALSKPGVALAPLTPEIMIETVHLPGDLHGDPADRMLVATARVTGATLLTKDERLIRYAKQRHVRAIEA
jgi:PIN domain nuclease of toxin-antitoxin system